MRRWSAAFASSSLLLAFAFTNRVAPAQTNNLLRNSDANEGAQHWQAKGEATVEVAEDGNAYFIIRNAGTFTQVVALPENAVGQHALLIGRASSERIVSDRATAGFPTLQGYMISGDPGAVRTYGALEGQYLSSRATTRNEWVNLWGIFRVPMGTERISLIIGQELKPGVQHDDPPARFDDLGLYLFPTEQEARKFVGPAAASAEIPNAGNIAPAPECTMTHAPVLYGIQLGMSVEHVLNLFPRSSQDPDVIRMLEKSKATGKFGLTDLQIVPSRYGSNATYADVKLFTLRFLDGRALSIHVRYGGPGWKDTDEFISKTSDAWGLPGHEAWQSMFPRNEKSLRCRGFEVRSFGAPREMRSYIYLIDLLAEKRLIERQAAAKQ